MAPPPEDRLLPLLVDAAGTPCEPLDAALSAEAPAAERSDPAVPRGTLAAPGQDPNDLALQRWGIVVGRSITPARWQAYKAQLTELAQARARQQGAPVRVFRVPSGLDHEGLRAWYQLAVRPDGGSEHERPEYLLVLGDYDEVSLEAERFLLGRGQWVGRLALGDPEQTEAYAAYAAKVLRHEARPLAQAQARALFHSSLDGTAAVNAGHTHLVTPLLAQARAQQGPVDFPAREVLDLTPTDETADVPTALETPTPAAFLARTAEATGDVLFTLSHGCGAPDWTEAQRRSFQGALSFPGTDPDGFGLRVDATHVAQGPFLPGGLWFAFACFSAGTPARSNYLHWLKRLAELNTHWGSQDWVLDTLSASEHGFTAALPRAALTNPEGPLGVVGHVDLAFTYSFTFQGEAHTQTYRHALAAMLGAPRLGQAMAVLGRRLSAVHTTLVTQQEMLDMMRASGMSPPPAMRKALGYRMLHRHDVAGFTLLGDPAARLPTAGSEPVIVDASVAAWAPGADG